MRRAEPAVSAGRDDRVELPRARPITDRSAAHLEQRGDLPDSVSYYRAVDRDTNRCGELFPDQRERVRVNCWPDTVHRHRHGDRNRKQRCLRRAGAEVGHVRDLSVRLLPGAVRATYLGWWAANRPLTSRPTSPFGWPAARPVNPDNKHPSRNKGRVLFS